MTTDELRAKFESAISSFDPNEFKAIFSLERGEDGGYKDEAILALWNGYRLGYASRDAEVEALKRDAERYQALRLAFAEDDEVFIEKITDALRGRDCTAAEFDAAVDTAREKQP